MRKTVYGLFLITFLTSALTLAFDARQLGASGTIYIRTDGSIDPDDGRIVTSDKVHYYFNQTVIYGSIVVQRDNIIVDGGGYTLEGQGNGTGISVSNRKNVAIRNVTVKAFDRSIDLQFSSLCNVSQTNTWIAISVGIYLKSSSGNTLSGNTATNNNWGIYLDESSSNNTIFGNTVTEGNSEGIGVFYSSSNNTLFGNTVTNSKYRGIYLKSSSGNTLSGNTVTNAGIAGDPAAGDGILLEDSSYNTLSGNKVTNGNADGICLYDSSSSNTLSGNTVNNNNFDGICLYDSSSSNTLSGNIVDSNEGYGILLKDSSYNTLSGNTVNNNNFDGICLYDSSSSNTLSGNIVDSNEGYGIDFEDSSYNTLSGNSITNNNCGIFLEGSLNNTLSGNSIAYNNFGVYSDDASGNNDIYHNNFVENEVPVDDYSSNLNSWDNGYPSGGNYWSDYAGTDSFGGPYQNQTGSDGIGDTPYVVNENNADRYPFTVPLGPIPVFYKGASYDCLITSNMTLSRFCTLAQDKTMNFRTIGQGWVNLTVQREFLDGAFRILVNNTETPWLSSWNRTHTSIYFECRESGSNNIEIEGQIKLEGDINCDGIVNILDIFKVANNFGKNLEP